MIVRDFARKSHIQKKRLTPPTKMLVLLLSIVVPLGVLLLVASVLIRLSVPVFLRSSAAGAVVYVPAQVEKSYPVVYRSKAKNDGSRTTYFGSPDFLVDAPGGYGRYRLGALYALYTQEGKDAAFIQAAFSRVLGVPLDGVYSYELSTEEALAQEISSHVPTFFLQKLVGVVAGGSLPVFQEHPLSGDDFVARSREDFKKERGSLVSQCSLALLNASEKKGVATALSTLLESLQYQVVHTASLPDTQDASVVYVAAQASDCSETLATIQRFFTTKPQLIVEETPEVTEQYRAGIVIVLGKSY